MIVYNCIIRIVFDLISPKHFRIVFDFFELLCELKSEDSKRGVFKTPFLNIVVFYSYDVLKSNYN